MNPTTRAMTYLLGRRNPEAALTHAIDRNDVAVVTILCQQINPQDYHIQSAIVKRNLEILNSLIDCGGNMTKDLKDLKEYHEM